PGWPSPKRSSPRSSKTTANRPERTAAPLTGRVRTFPVSQGFFSMKVHFRAIRKNYESFTAVHNLDLTIESGALHFLLGPSGCGKTTTLRMLAGLEQPSAGQILFGDQDVTR